MANYIATDTDLTAVADAIRTKGGTSEQLEFPQGFVDAISAIETDGGGDAFNGLSVIRKIELSEPVRSVQIDIPSGVDWVYVLISGGFTKEDWLYWAINSTTSNYYQNKTKDINTGFVLTNSPNNGLGKMLGYHAVNNNMSVVTSSSPMTFFSIYGYSADFLVGTKIFVYGGKYADM